MRIKRQKRRRSRASNRAEHLVAALIAGLALCALALSFEDPRDALIVGLIVPFWELVATPDVDHNSRKVFRGSLLRRLWALFWWPYKKLIPHRSAWSHSLLKGFPLRLLYVVLPLQLLLPYFGAAWIAHFVLAALVADVVHLWLDGYAPKQMLLGR